MKPLEIKFIDHGIAAEHNMPCSVYQDKSAVFDMNTRIFQPCWEAQKEGWTLIKLPKFLRFLKNWLKN
jgi:hypothetical protein